MWLSHIKIKNEYFKPDKKLNKSPGINALECPSFFTRYSIHEQTIWTHMKLSPLRTSDCLPVPPYSLHSYYQIACSNTQLLSTSLSPKSAIFSGPHLVSKFVTPKCLRLLKVRLDEKNIGFKSFHFEKSFQND